MEMTEKEIKLCKERGYGPETIKNIRLSEERSKASDSIKAEWKIGYHSGIRSVHVEVKYKGRRFVKYDYDGFLPRWMRIGIYVVQLMKEANIYEEYEFRKDGSYGPKCFSDMHVGPLSE